MSSALSEHQVKTGHRVNATKTIKDEVRVIDRQAKDYTRKVAEAINIKMKNASLNRNDGLEIPNLYFPLLREKKMGGGARD